MVYSIIRTICFPIIRAIFLRKATGLSNIPKKGGFILAANHASYVDPVFLSMVIIPKINRKIHFIALKKYFQNPFQKPFFKHFGAIPANGATETAVSILKQDKTLGMFPEGGRTKTGKIGKFHTGVAVVAMLSKKPVIPIGIRSTFEIWPITKRLPSLKKIAEIHIGKPIYPRGKLTKTDINKNVKRIRDKIKKLAGEKR